MKEIPSPPSASVGRPRKGRVPVRITLAPDERIVAKRKAFQMGTDLSAYLSALIRKDNTEKFPARFTQS